MLQRFTRALLDGVFVHNPKQRLSRITGLVILGFTYALGALFWSVYFAFGRAGLLILDWIKESVYLETLRTALFSIRIPWEWTSAYYHPSPRFAANPEVCLTPDVLTLPYLSNPAFVLLHVLILYTIGYLGALALARRQRVGPAALGAFWLIFNLNGYITSSLSVGHFQWTGYFLLPCFFAAILTAADSVSDRVTWKTAVVSGTPLALIFGLLFLNGSFHIAVWTMMFLALVTVFLPRLWPVSMFSIASGLLLGVGRLVPAALYFSTGKPEFVTGYPNLNTLTAGLLQIRAWDFTAGGRLGTLAWSEFDAFLGYATLAGMILCFALALPGLERGYRALLGASAVMFVLSLGDTWHQVTQVMPILGLTERVSTRFIVFPLLTVLIVALRGLAVALSRWRFRTGALLLIWFPFAVRELWLHVMSYNPQAMLGAIGAAPIPALTLLAHPAAAYTRGVGTCWAISMLALLGLVLTWRLASNNTPAAQTEST